MKNLAYIFLAIVLIGFTSCEELFTTVRDIDIPEHDRKLSVNTALSGDSIVTFISHSKEFDDNTPYTNIDAQVSLMKEGEEIITFEYNNANNPKLILKKKLNDTIQEGAEYTLIIDSKKYGTAKSTETAPKSSTVQSLNFDETTIQGEYRRYNNFEFVIDDEKEDNNYYSIKFYIDGGHRDGRYLYASTKDPQVKEIYISVGLERNYYGSEVFLVSDKNFNGLKRKFTFEITKPYSNPNGGDNYKIIMEVANVTKGYYNFLISQQQADLAEENPFAEPVVVTGNIENGYGVFNVFTSKKYVIYEE